VLTSFGAKVLYGIVYGTVGILLPIMVGCTYLAYGMEPFKSPADLLCLRIGIVGGVIDLVIIFSLLWYWIGYNVSRAWKKSK
jgi:hypothetical protein